MPETDLSQRHRMITMDQEVFTDHFAEDVRKGLSSKPRKIPPKYFYDDEGSRLFEEICELPEYYLTRAEREILDTYASEILGHLKEETALVELGSGSAVKTRILIEHLMGRQGALRYHPIDISPGMLEQSSEELLERYEDLQIVSVAAEYRRGLARLNLDGEMPKMILWLGSSIGNFERYEAVDFVTQIVDNSHSCDFFLFGIDLAKDARTLEAAYDDSRGVTAAFNMNLLHRINRELSGHFNPDTFRHKAVYNEEAGRVEMHLESLREQTVAIDDLELDVHFRRGETIHTENSYKYTTGQIRDFADQSGMKLVEQWLDSKKQFSLNLFQQKSL